ncbi:glycosyltransferase family 4 protein [Shewanella gaetbuli]
MSKTKVLHIVSDYPDHTKLNNTKAVKNLLEATDNNFEHKVVALRRIKNLKIQFFKFESYYYFQVPSLPFALFHVLLSLIYSIYLYKKIKNDFIEFDIIHAHKLTIDGLFAFFLSKMTNIDFVLSVRADTDLKFINRKPLSRWLFKKVFRDSKHIFWVSAWSKPNICQMLHHNHNNESLLPNIVSNASSKVLSKKITNSKKFIFVGRLESAEKKGLLHVIQALEHLPDYSLDIYGPPGNNLEKILKYISEHHMQERVSIKGVLSKDDLLKEYNNYCALLMPSKNETFGMVYVESLLNGLPVLCCEGSGIDGYITNSNYFSTVSFGDVKSIANAIKCFYVDQFEIKQKLMEDIINGKLSFFEVENIQSSYVRDLLDVKKNN